MKARHSILAAAISLALAPVAFAQSTSPSMGSQAGMASSPSMNMETVRQVQQQLTDMGHNPGPVDGIFGPQTRSAVRDFQQAKGMQGSGTLNQETMTALGVDGGSMSGGSSGSTSGGSSGSMGSGSSGATSGGSTGSTSGGTSGSAGSSGATGGQSTGSGATGSGTTAPDSGARSGSTPRSGSPTDPAGSGSSGSRSGQSGGSTSGGSSSGSGSADSSSPPGQVRGSGTTTPPQRN